MPAAGVLVWGSLVRALDQVLVGNTRIHADADMLLAEPDTKPEQQPKQPQLPSRRWWRNRKRD